jgi:undecaprenyl-diphosphatase
MGIPLTLALIVLILGGVQGIAEFLPVSSGGHLGLAAMLLGEPLDPAVMVSLHVGTWLAAFALVRKPVSTAVVEGMRGLVHPSFLKETRAGRDATAIILATIPTAIVGLALQAPSEVWSSSPTLIGVGFFGSALAIGSTYWAPAGEEETPTHWGSVLVGIAQGASVLPGLSRTGLTLATLLWLGIRAERAFELSLLMSLPALAGALLLELRAANHAPEAFPVLLLGALVAALAGRAALAVLRAALARRLVAAFAIYLVPLGIATLAWGYARP